MTVITDWARYFTPTAAHRHLGLYCLGVGRQTGRSAPLETRALDCYAAVLIRHGEGRLSWTGEPSGVPLRSPVLFWLFPGLCHAYAPAAKGWSELWVLFDGIGPRSYEELGYLSRLRPVQTLDESSQIPGIFEQVVKCGHDPAPHADVEAAALIHRLLVQAKQEIAVDPDTPVQLSLVASLQADACTPLSIEEHARRLGVSVPVLRGAVRAAGGQNPKELILQSRLTEAKALLAETSLPIYRVAEEVGYDDAAYFTRLFTKRVGVPPRVFRHQQVGLRDVR